MNEMGGPGTELLEEVYRRRVALQRVDVLHATPDGDVSAVRGKSEVAKAGQSSNSILARPTYTIIVN
jgi:hypothetical protein